MTESVIREMTRYSQEVDAINLAQGFPDFAPDQRVIEAAQRALAGDNNQYSITWGARSFRTAVADYYQRWYDLLVDPQREITICCGSTEAMLASVMATVNPGQRVIIFEPFYENYIPDTILTGAEAVFVTLHEEDGDWLIPWQELEEAAADGFAAMIINTPNNPTGKIFSGDELSRIGTLCQQHDAVLISDEIYDHICFDGKQHVLPAAVDTLRDRTITINSLSKTFAVTGWRVGWAVAPPEITDAIRKVHDFTTVGAPHPLQVAGADLLGFDDDYFNGLADFYQERRDLLTEGLRAAGFKPKLPRGAYYMLAEYDDGGAAASDQEFSYRLAREAGVATVPGSSFHRAIDNRSGVIRFCFGKKLETLEAVSQRLHTWANG